MPAEKTEIYRSIPLAALFAALGVVFPMFFHLLGLGSAFLPMFLPILMAGFLLPFQLSATIALLTPLVSFLFTGMPPLYPPVLPLMIAELLLMLLIIRLLRRQGGLAVWFILLAALITDRIFLFLFIYWLAPFFGFPEKLFSLAAVVHGLPGILMTMIVVPPGLRLIAEKYPEVLVRYRRGAAKPNE